MDILRPIRPIITNKPNNWIDGLTCPDCGQTNNYQGYGKTRHGKQRYKCMHCNRIFSGAKTGRPTKDS